MNSTQVTTAEAAHSTDFPFEGIGSIFSILTVKHKPIFMRSILYIIAVILIIGWLLGVFAYSAGGLIHILIVIAVIALLLAIIRLA